MKTLKKVKMAKGFLVDQNVINFTTLISKTCFYTHVFHFGFAISGIQQSVANSIPPLRSFQKSQQIHQQYNYSKFQNDSSAEVDWSQVPKQNVTKNPTKTSAEGILIDLNEDATPTNLYKNVGPSLKDEPCFENTRGKFCIILKHSIN